MTLPITRIVAILLAVCLLVDPAALAAANTFPGQPVTGSSPTIFICQALSARGLPSRISAPRMEAAFVDHLLAMQSGTDHARRFNDLREQRQELPVDSAESLALFEEMVKTVRDVVPWDPEELRPFVAYAKMILKMVKKRGLDLSSESMPLERFERIVEEAFGESRRLLAMNGGAPLANEEQDPFKDRLIGIRAAIIKAEGPDGLSRLNAIYRMQQRVDPFPLDFYIQGKRPIPEQIFRNYDRAFAVMGIPLSKSRVAIERSLRLLAETGTDSSTKTQAAHALIENRDKLSVYDLERLVRLISERPTADPFFVDTVGIALQRRWDGIDPEVRNRLMSSLANAAQRGILTSDRVVAFQRPIFISLTAEELRHVIPANAGQAWSRATLSERILWSRLAVRAAQKKLNVTWIPREEVFNQLPVPGNHFSAFYRKQGLDPALFSFSPRYFSPALVRAVVYTLQQQPNEVIPEKRFIETLGKNYTAFQQWGRQLTKKTSAVYLANEFHVSMRTKVKDREPGEVTALLPLVDNGFHQFMRERDITLDLNAGKKPTLEESVAIRELLEGLARSAKKTVESLNEKDFYSHLSPLTDRQIFLGGFYKLASSANKTGYKTVDFIRMRYGFQKVYPPLKRIQTPEDFREILLAGILDRNPYPNMSKELSRALVLKFAEEKGKDVLWLSSVDYEGDLEALSIPGKPFKMRNFYLHFHKDPLRKNEATPLFLLKKLGLVKKSVTFTHPIELSTTQQEIKDALQNGWIKKVPWCFVSLDLKILYVLELAQRVGGNSSRLRAPMFVGKKNTLHSLIYTLRDGKKQYQNIQGIYREFYKDPLRRNTGMTTVDYMNHVIAKRLSVAA